MKKFLIAIVVLLALAVGWFFLYFVKMPMYSLGMAGYAYWKKDYPMFEQYVDVPTITINGYNDLAPIYLPKETAVAKNKAARIITGAISNVFGMKAGLVVGRTLGVKVANEIVDSAVASIEPQIKEKLVTGVRDKLKTFFTELDEDKSKAEAMKEEAPGKISLKGIKEESNLNGVAVMNVTLGNKRNELLPIKLRMMQKPDKEWKVIKVDNLNEVITKGPEFVK